MRPPLPGAGLPRFTVWNGVATPAEWSSNRYSVTAARPSGSTDAWSADGTNSTCRGFTTGWAKAGATVPSRTSASGRSVGMKGRLSGRNGQNCDVGESDV
jgi:hypothetical protein